MKKAVVLGCPGSGKTTFSIKLHKATGLPLIHLDGIWHRADRTHITREEFDAKLEEIFTMDEWIMDGDYSRTMELRIQHADTVIFFDLPTEVCLEGITARVGQKRVDMPWVDEVLDPWLENKVKEFPREERPQICELLEKYKNEKQIIVFKSRDEANEYLGERKGGTTKHF